jgi:pimeloyl-[acyl-carrier protein] synthase
MASPSTPSPAPAVNPLMNPALQENPYGLYAMLRAGSPVFRPPIPAEVGAGVVLLTRHADVEAVLRDPDHRFSVQRREADVFRLFADRLPAAVLEGPVGARSMLLQDPPAHTRLRGLVSRAFTPRRVAELGPRVTALVDELLGAALARGEADWIHDVAEPLPAVVIAELLGVPPEDHRTFRGWSSRLIDSLPAFGQEGASDEVEALIDTVADYLREQIARRRADPRDDLLSALIEARDAKDALSEEELVATAFLLLVAGHETTTNLIGNGLLALLRHPDQLDWLRADPAGRVENAVEEMLRFDSPVQGTVRVAREDVEIGGQAVARGALVVCGIGAANRDPAVHADPDRLDLAREPIRHLSFGFGTHFCLGASLARLEGRAVFQALAQRVARVERLSGTLEYRANPILRGLRSLPVRLVAA